MATLVYARLDEPGYSRVRRASGTRGATTLSADAANVTGDRIVLYFKGKSGKQRQLEPGDGALARSIRYCQELPGQRLFQSVNGSGRRFDVTRRALSGPSRAESRLLRALRQAR